MTRSLRSTRQWAGATEASRLRSDAGQTTTEWLMIAAVFTAVVLLLYELVPTAIQVYSAGLIHCIRTIAP